MYRYLAIFDACGDLPGSYTVTFPDVPEAVTQGGSLADAMEMAVDVLELSLDLYVKSGKDLPPVKTKRGKGARWIEVSALAQIKLALYEEFRKTHISKMELAKRMGIAKQQMGGLFALQHSSRVEQLESAFRAIGRKITFAVEAEDSMAMSA